MSDTTRLARGRAISTLFLLCVVLGAPAQAQFAADARVSVGRPIRLTDPSGSSQLARYAGQSPAGLLVRYDCRGGCDSTTTVPWSEVARLDALVPQGGSVDRILIGGVAGFASGLVVGAITTAVATKLSCTEQDEYCSLAIGIVVVPAGVLLGTIVGLTKGWRSRTEAWERVWPPR